MPVRTGKDVEGCYARWGGHGAKYRYTCGDKEGEQRAKDKAGKQGQAAHANGYGKKVKTVGGFRIN